MFSIDNSDRSSKIITPLAAIILGGVVAGAGIEGMITIPNKKNI